MKKISQMIRLIPEGAAENIRLHSMVWPDIKH
jgi:L-rhamnose mutarotase